MVAGLPCVVMVVTSVTETGHRSHLVARVPHMADNEDGWAKKWRWWVQRARLGAELQLLPRTVGLILSAIQKGLDCYLPNET